MRYAAVGLFILAVTNSIHAQGEFLKEGQSGYDGEAGYAYGREIVGEGVSFG